MNVLTTSAGEFYFEEMPFEHKLVQDVKLPLNVLFYEFLTLKHIFVMAPK